MKSKVLSKPTIITSKEVNPKFYPVWLSNKPYNVLKGGRNSFKSSVIALLLVNKMNYYISKGKRANVVVIRKVASTLRDSVYNKIIWALGKYGYSVGKNGHFKDTVSPFRITHNRTGSTFYFYGLDQYEKLKSNDINDIIAVWYEETAEFNGKEEIDQTNITFMRQKEENAPFVQFFYSYNPPRNQYSWINEEVEKLKDEDDYLIHHSSYLDDALGFVTDQMLADIDRVKKNDYDYYRYLYLGEPVGLGTNVYNMDLFKPLDAFPDDEIIIYLATSTDTGYSVSATTTSSYAITNKNNVILLNTIYYDPEGKSNKRDPQGHGKELRRFIKEQESKWNKPVAIKIIDSADGALRNQYFNDYNERLHPVNKKTKLEMTEYVNTLLAQGRVFYLDTKDNEIWIEQHKKYQWDSKSLERNPDNPSVVKVDDHTCDQFQYFVVDSLQLLNLKY